MSKQTQHVLEYSKPIVSGNVICKVKIIGLKSTHGYAYPTDVLMRAVGLYEGAPVFLCHPDQREKKRGSRMLRDHFGSLENVKGHEFGLFGDLNVRSSHPLAAQILEEAPTASFGLSHNAVVEKSEDGSKVTNIVEVNSVDLVDDPATTHNLFEEGKESAGVNVYTFDQPTLEALNRLVAALEAKPAVPVTEEKAPPKRLVALENNVAGGGGAPVGNSHEDFLGAVRGFKVT